MNDCELGQFSEWSACTATCGSGLRTQPPAQGQTCQTEKRDPEIPQSLCEPSRSRSIQVEASGGGSWLAGKIRQVGRTWPVGGGGAHFV